MEVVWLWPAGLSVLLLIGGWLDTRYRRFPNWLALVLLLFGLSHCAATGGIPSFLSGLGHAVVALIVGMVFFGWRMIGGGDAKFYAGAASYFVLNEGLLLLLAVSLSGLVLVLLWILLRRITEQKISKSTGDRGKFPYGVAIAVGTIAAALYPHSGSAAVF